MSERRHRGISRQVYSIKRDILGRDDFPELKGTNLINARTFRRVPQKRELVESLFSLLGTLDVTFFAIVVPRPTRELNIPENHLPSPHKFLLQRINALAEEVKQEAVLVYDGNGMNVQGLNMSACISDYIFKVAEYNNILRRIVDTALFVDSRVTPGIQLADLAASVVRQYEQNKLYESAPPSDDFLSAIERYYKIIQAKTSDDLENDYGERLYGFYRMREEQLYAATDEE